MPRIILILLTVLCLSTGLFSQYDIDIEVTNYDNDTLIVGSLYGDKQLVRDTLFATQKGQFKLAGTDTLENGVYLLLSFPDNEYVQFHVNDHEKKFKIKYDYNDKANIEFDGTIDNESFAQYMNLVKIKRPEADTLRKQFQILKDDNQSTEHITKSLAEIDAAVKGMQEDIISKYPESITALILKANRQIDVPEFEGEDSNIKRYRYYKNHYFDNIDLGNPDILKTTILPEKIDYYINKLTVNHPDSINLTLDNLLTKMEPSEQTYRYYLSTFLNTYAKSKFIGYDGIYVHLVDKYYSKGKAPWLEEESLLKIVDKANKIRPALIGKIGADIEVFQEDGSTISISDIDYEYLVLLFWAPDCGHCTKQMPKYVEFNKKWKDKGIKTFAICTKHQDKTAKCWEDLEKKDMLGFINGADQYHRSRFKLKYNVYTTPKVFILNKEREILLKNLGSDQLEDAITEILKKDNSPLLKYTTEEQ